MINEVINQGNNSIKILKMEDMYVISLCSSFRNFREIFRGTKIDKLTYKYLFSYNISHN